MPSRRRSTPPVPRRPVCCRRSRTASQYRNSRRVMPNVVSRCSSGGSARRKGVHLALQAAHRAGVALLIAGELYPYAAHRDYFECRGPAAARPASAGSSDPWGFARKRRLLTAARCLLVPSLAEETSSLVAREAAACGTAVIATSRNGALRDTVLPGRTGLPGRDGGRHGACHCRERSPSTPKRAAPSRAPASTKTA